MSERSGLPLSLTLSWSCAPLGNLAHHASCGLRPAARLRRSLRQPQSPCRPHCLKRRVQAGGVAACGSAWANKKRRASCKQVRTQKPAIATQVDLSTAKLQGHLQRSLCHWRGARRRDRRFLEAEHGAHLPPKFLQQRHRGRRRHSFRTLRCQICWAGG